jgi:hypothetical protein
VLLFDLRLADKPMATAKRMAGFGVKHPNGCGVGWVPLERYWNRVG